MAQIIEARVFQKADTLSAWMSNPLILGRGEQAFVISDTDSGNIIYKVGDGTKTFAELPWPDYSVKGRVDTTTVWSGMASGVYIPTEDGDYGAINGDVALSDGYQIIFWDGDIRVKVVFPTDLSGYPYVRTSPNLFNKDVERNAYTSGMTKDTTGIILGAYMGVDGTLTANSQYAVTDFIDLPTPGVQYTAKSNSDRPEYIRFRTVFDAGNTAIPASGSATSHSQFTTGYPKVRLTIFIGDIDSFRLYRGDNADVYIPYGNVLSDTSIKMSASQIEDSGDLLYIRKDTTDISTENVNFISTTDNDLDLGQITRDRYVVASTGALATPSGGTPIDRYFASGFIKRKEGATHLRLTQGHQCAFYTSNSQGSYISGQVLNAYDVLVPWPASAQYMRVGILTSLLDSAMIVQGNSSVALPETYQPHKVLDGVSVAGLNEKAEKDEILLLDIPEICIAVGRTIEIYNNQIAWCGNHDNYHFFWTGAGKSMKRKWTCTGTPSNVGSYSLSLTVFDNNMNQVAQKTYPLKIVAVPSFSSEVRILPIGDSLTNYKLWENTLYNEHANIKLVGSRWGNGTASVPFRHEGRSGWAASHYIANSTYTFDTGGVAGADGRGQQYNPFWNNSTGQIDFEYYTTNWNVDPTHIIIWLGTNGIALDPNANANNIKSFVDSLRATGATQKIFIVNTLYRGDQNGLGNQGATDGFTATPTWKLQEDRKVFNLHNKLVELLNGYSNLYFIPVSATHDSEYNFTPDPDSPYSPTAVNPRAWQTEYLPTEGTHPQSAGYLQIEDTIFSHLVANI